MLIDPAFITKKNTLKPCDFFSTYDLKPHIITKSPDQTSSRLQRQISDFIVTIQGYYNRYILMITNNKISFVLVYYRF